MKLKILAILLLSHFTLLAQNSDFRIMFYNVENLFDTVDHPVKYDEEFTPESRKEWDHKKYKKKLSNLSKVIGTANGKELPAVIGLCEVENRKVLEDLITQKEFKRKDFGIVHYESPDARGIDMAMLYNKKEFSVIKSQSIQVDMPFDLDYKTRDILFVQGVFKNSDTIHFYVCHWPSRRGGQQQSEPRRKQAASVLKTHMDSLINTNNHAKIIIMGDLNDEPQDNSVKMICDCDSTQLLNDSCFFNYSSTIPEEEGTYYYWRSKEWNVLDHIIVSSNLINAEKGITVPKDGFTVMKEDWMLRKDENGVMVPHKSFSRQYDGGYSDHLPLLLDLKIN